MVEYDDQQTFTGELAIVTARKMNLEKIMYGAPPMAKELTTMTFDDILADFVTPGDLLKSPSLERVQTIKP